MKDYYAILGVSYTATELEIKRTYRRLAVKYHPDKNPDPKVETLFKEINEAYDVLSDPEKKMFYDLKRQNPYAGFVQEEIVTQPGHRDPRYRRKPVNPQAKKGKSERAHLRELMSEYLPYAKWFCWAGLVFTVVFFADYFLPYQSKQEEIVDSYSVRGRRNSYLYTVYVTESGKKIKSQGISGIGMGVGKAITYEHTLAYGTVMTISDKTDKITTAYVYGGIAFFAGVLFVIAALGLVFQKEIEFCFNASVVSGILLFINLYLILWS